MSVNAPTTTNNSTIAPAKVAPLFITVFFTFCFLMIASCASSSGVYHTVRKGETLWRICHTYDVSIQDVAEINNIKNASKIRVGQKVFIPGRTSIKNVPAKTSKTYTKKKTKTGSRKVKIEKGKFAWPVKGKVIRPYGIEEGGTKHDGIDIKAKKNTPVKSSAAGTVVHAEKNARVFGNILILKHPGEYYTIYAHNEANLVKLGDKVKKGATIARVGKSGDASDYQLHFEIRDGHKVRNPLFFLP